MSQPSYYEFFAGGGMARAGLGAGWRCLFANDFDAKKAASYRANWGGAEFRLGDIAQLTADDLPGSADLAWASFPCQDLSLAGAGKGLQGARSGLFFVFEKLMAGLRAQARAPKIIVLENVVGLLTSHGGSDFAAVTHRLATLGYRVGAMTIDAARFTPQSRPRVFFVALRRDVAPPARLVGAAPTDWVASAALRKAAARLTGAARDNWLWWAPPEPAHRNADFASIVEARPRGVLWHDADATQRLIGMMSATNLRKLETLKRAKGAAYATAYRRTRPDGAGGRASRVELRADGLAGCLRTAAGGSSRQIVFEAKNGVVRSRLLSPHEAARLMGLPEDYILPGAYNEAYHLLGDGVAVNVARHLRETLFEPTLAPLNLLTAAE